MNKQELLSFFKNIKKNLEISCEKIEKNIQDKVYKYHKEWQDKKKDNITDKKKPEKPDKKACKHDFNDFLIIYTTNAGLMMKWYQSVFGFEFYKYRYDVKTVRPLYYYAAYTPKNKPWKITNIKGILLHPAYDESDCWIKYPVTSLGFDWKNYDGVEREPIYKFELNVSNIKSLLNNFYKMGIHPVNKISDYEELIIFIYHTSKYVVTDPRGNTLSLWDVENCYKLNVITNAYVTLNKW